MATTAVKLGEEVTIGTTPIEYLITDTNAALQRPFTTVNIQMGTNSGTIQFSVGETPPAANKAWATGTAFVMHGVQNGVYNLWALGSGAGQKFTIS